MPYRELPRAHLRVQERAAKLIAACARYQGSIAIFKGRGKRRQAVSAFAVKQAAKDRFLELLGRLDDHIALRNQNTHETFLSLGYSTGHDICDPHDALLDVQAMDGAALEPSKDVIAGELIRAVGRYEEKTDRILDLTRQIVEELHFATKASSGARQTI